MLAAVFLGGQIAHDLFGKIGLGSTAAIDLVLRALAGGAGGGHGRLRDRLRPGPRHRAAHVRWLTPGAVVGVVLWIALSLGFSIYVRNFSSYGAVYGVFAAAIVLLLWLYLSANAFLFGAELNAELERAAGADQASARSVSSGG